MKYSSRQTPNKHWLKRIDWVLIGILTILAILVSHSLVQQWVAVNIVPILV